MKSSDQNIRELLSQRLNNEVADAVSPDPLLVEESLLQAVRGRSRRLAVLAPVLQMSFGIAMSVTAVAFLKADNLHAEVMLAAVMVMLLNMAMAFALWTWMRTHHNATQREIKRVELTLAILAEQHQATADL